MASGEEDKIIKATGRPVSSKQYKTTVRPHEPWKEDVPAKSIMSLSEIDKRLQYSEFATYMQETQKEWSPQNNTPEAVRIKKEVETLASQLVEFLRSKYRMFAGCKLLKTGSSYEGVKLGGPDEFDFMIEVPALQDEKIIQIKVPRHKDFPYTATVKNPGFFADVYPHMTKESSGHASVNFWVELRKIILEFVSNFCERNKNWEVIQDPPIQLKGFACDMQEGGRFRRAERYVEKGGLAWAAKLHAAITFSLRWNGREFPNQEVSLDFCIAVPVLANQRNHTDLYYITEVDKSVVPKLVVCHVLLLTKFFCRLSFSMEEMRIMKMYPYPQEQNVCMRLLKYLRDSELPQDKDPETNELLMKMPSYWIKTVLYGLYSKYPDASSWKGRQLAIRAIEALDILVDGCARIDLPNYFIPSYNLLLPSKKTRQLAENLKKIQKRFLTT